MEDSLNSQSSVYIVKAQFIVKINHIYALEFDQNIKMKELKAMIQVAAHLKKNFSLFSNGKIYDNYNEETFESLFPSENFVCFYVKGENFEESKIEKLKEESNNEEEEYFVGKSKKRPKKQFLTTYKLLIFITIISSLISIFLLYKIYKIKSTSNFLNLSESRFSVREYSQKPIEQEKINALLRVAQLSPTAANKQPQKIYIITKDIDKQKLKTVTKYTFDAPMFFLVCCDKNKAWKHKTEEYYSTEIDGSIVATNIILEAHDLGLGSVIVRSFQTQKLKELFGLPENMIPIVLLPIGYPKESTKPSENHFKRKDIEEIVEYF